MVAKITTGKSIAGALRYNEHKVEKGTAEVLAASGFPSPEMSVPDKCRVFEKRTTLNQRTKTNCVHVSLNFSPDESPDNGLLFNIAKEYLDRIGFEGQPFLLYKHTDAGHPHCHLVTTNIKPDGTAIPLHNIGRDKIEPARKEIEKLFGLLPAERDRKQEEAEKLQPVAEKVLYGKSETKAAISNTVRAVVRDYKFTSLAELNAVLRGFNVEAYRGEPGTKMFEKKGLTYHVLDRKGNRTGVPIKSSSIYTKPTLPNLEKVFEAGKIKRASYKQDLVSVIDKALQTEIKDRFAFRFLLKKEGIDVLFRENRDMVYGITFVDHHTKCVFNGSDLGKGYTAGRLLQRIAESGTREQNRQEKDLEHLQEYVSRLDLARTAQATVERIYADGYRLETGTNTYGNLKYYLSRQDGDNGVRAGGRQSWDDYFSQGGITETFCRHITDYILENGVTHLQDYLHALFAQPSEAVFGHITPDKKKPKRKVNW